MKSEILERHKARLEAELRFNLDDRKWWEQRVASGIMSREQAEGYIRAADDIIARKQYLLEIARQ